MRLNIAKTYWIFYVMEKLELKHLAPFLPFGLEYIEVQRNSYTGNPNIELRMVLTAHKIAYLLDKRHRVLSVKPILRPLSDLTEQHVADMTEYNDVENVVFSGNPSDLYFANTEEKTYLSEYVDHLNFLLKNHFDIFGLIEKGLAIDINALND